MSDRLFVATRKGLFTLARGDRGTSPWRITHASFLGDPVSIVLPDRRDGQVYAAIGHGHFGVKLHRSPDGGSSWEQCATPAYPPKPPEAPEVRCPMRGTPIPWDLELIWSLEPGGVAEPGVLWCGTVPGGLFRSTDRGSSWSLVRALWDLPERAQWFGGGLDHPGIHSICVDPRDHRRVLAGISCGGVWETTDGGASWTCRATGMYAEYMPPERRNDPNIQDPHRMVRCPRQPEKLWVQHHNGIFRSVDESKSWQDVPGAVPSTFGFAVAVHPHDGDTAWFVPAVSDQRRVPVDARVVVSRTRDGGRTFEVLTDGLPSQNAYDIVFRHALDVDERGDHLAFGSTTGSLWTSSDQGDHWSLIEGHLPPVYCVCFG